MAQFTFPHVLTRLVLKQITCFPMSSLFKCDKKCCIQLIFVYILLVLSSTDNKIHNSEKNAMNRNLSNVICICRWDKSVYTAVDVTWRDSVH